MDLTNPNFAFWEKFWLKFCYIESLKISHFFLKMSQNIFTCAQHWDRDDYFTCAQHWEGDDYFTCAQHWDRDDYFTCAQHWEGDDYFTCAQHWEGDDYFTCAQHWEGDDYFTCAQHWEGMITSKPSPKYYKFSPKFLADPFENIIRFCMFKWV